MRTLILRQCQGTQGNNLLRVPFIIDPTGLRLKAQNISLNESFEWIFRDLHIC